MHQIFDEIGCHLKQMGYKGSKRTYRKRCGSVDVLVELEPCDGGEGFRIRLGTHLAQDLDPGHRGGRRARDCGDRRTIADAAGREVWPFHADREGRIAMVRTLQRELCSTEALARQGVEGKPL